MSINVLNHGRLVWVNSIQSNADDMAYLRERFGFHPLDLEDCLSHIERPKIDEYDEYLFIVMHFPRYHKGRQVTRPSEVDFFIGPNFFVTVHDGSLKPMQHIWTACQNNEEERQQWMGKGVGRLFYNILDDIVDHIFPMLDKVGAKISDIEENMFTRDMPRILQHISLVRRDIIALRRVIRPQLNIIHNLERKGRPYIQESLDVYFGDVADAYARASDIVEDYREVIEGLSATADSVTSYRINEIMRILTVISVIMLPLTLIAGIYGMNVILPLGSSPHGFLYVMLFMLLISVLMLAYFRHRHWL
jgi:magnesium transporter